MRLIYTLVLLISAVIIFSACTQAITPPQTPPPIPPIEPQMQPSVEPPELPPEAGPIRDPRCPASCNDNNMCTQDICNLQTDFECRYAPINPCCGNGICESDETSISCTEDCTGDSKIFSELIQNSARVESMGYSYQSFDGEILSDNYEVKREGPLTLIKYDRLKSEPDGFSYNNVIVNDTSQNALLFCSPNCGTHQVPVRIVKNIGRFEQRSPIEFLHSLTNVSVIGEENIEGKAGTVLRAVSVNEVVRVKIWKFYGVPMLIETLDTNEQILSRIRYRNMDVNGVKSSDFALPPNSQIQAE